MRKRTQRRQPRGLTPVLLNEIFLPAQAALALLDTRHFRVDQATELAFFLNLAQVSATDRRNAAVCRAASQAMDILIRLRDTGEATGDWSVGESDRAHLIAAIVASERYLRSLNMAGMTRSLQKLFAWSQAASPTPQ